MKQPIPTWLYRITHIDNLQHILQNGLVVASSHRASPNFRRIGDSSLIEYRKELQAPETLGGVFADYIPFYFGPRSPMLLQIATGWEDIEQIHQSKIIYIISSVEVVVNHNLTFFFSDGHARKKTSDKYTNIKDLKKLDWEAIYATDWKDSITDLRRKEKKQAEFFVKEYFSVDCILKIGVFDLIAHKKNSRILAMQKQSIEIVVSPQKLYYDHL